MTMTIDQLDAVFNRIIAEAVAEEFRDKITDDTDLLDVGLDSFNLIKIIMQLEDELGIFWPVEQLAEHENFTVVSTLRTACHQYAEGTVLVEGDKSL
ncbi:acyl carrier protein [Brevibacillus dissolubilis]|uniref:acyl carrier protein n=1 Tax=Brevibacillus dissolubilis TaxID=1844116 RepID=UPI0011175CBD|nr:acyl carrier protein [Brevibacillus dissolubilis]